MSRILFWLALVFLVMFAIRSKLRGLQQRAREQQARQAGQHGRDPFAPPGAGPGQATRALPEAEPMLSCAACGIYYPASESVRADGRDYCSAAHARLPAH